MSNCKLSLSVVSDSTKWTLISALNMNIQSVFMIILEWFFVLLAITTLKFNVHQAGFAKSSFYPQCPCSNQHSGTTQIHVCN